MKKRAFLVCLLGCAMILGGCRGDSETDASSEQIETTTTTDAETSETETTTAAETSASAADTETTAESENSAIQAETSAETTLTAPWKEDVELPIIENETGQNAVPKNNVSSNQSASTTAKSEKASDSSQAAAFINDDGVIELPFVPIE